MISGSLFDVARDRQPVYYSDSSMPWEERLALAYDEASSVLAAALPKGKVLNPATSALASEAVSYEIGSNSRRYENSLIEGVDIPDDVASKLKAEESRDFVLGKYHSACQGLGAYLTGYARQMVASGAMTQDMFDRDAEARLRQLSDVIHSHRTETLVSTVTPEQPVAIASRNLKILDPVSGLVFIRTRGVDVTVQPKQGASGLGDPATVAIISGAVALTVAVVGLAAVAATVYAFGVTSQAYTEARARAMEACEKAQIDGHPQADKICKNLANIVGDGSSLAEMLFPKDVMTAAVKSAMPWVLGGVGAIIVLSNLGSIIDGIRSASRPSDYRLRDRQVSRLQGLQHHLQTRGY